jgi:CubicO group peptidase (beta-lactamase class C family)
VAPWIFDALAGAGALRSTADDLLTYLAFQFDPPDTALGAAARLTQETRARRGRMQVGLAWMRVPVGGGIVFRNGGTGGFRSIACFAPDRRAAAVVLGASARPVDALGMGLLLEVAGPVRAGGRTRAWRRGPRTSGR